MKGCAGAGFLGSERRTCCARSANTTTTAGNEEDLAKRAREDLCLLVAAAAAAAVGERGCRATVSNVTTGLRCAVVLVLLAVHDGSHVAAGSVRATVSSRHPSKVKLVSEQDGN